MSKRLEGGYLAARPTWSPFLGTPGVWAPEQLYARQFAGLWPEVTPLSDPYFESVSLLLHMNGTNGSTTFTDSSSNALTVTANGNAQISTAQSKFGGSSASFDGTEDYLIASLGSQNTAGEGDYTLECWVYPTAYKDTLNNHIAHFKNDASNATTVLAWASTNNGTISVSTGQTALLAGSGTYRLTLNAWNHVAVSRSGSTMRLFVNGMQDASVTDSTSRSFNTVMIARYSYATITGLEWTGYIDDFRITKNAARYTTNFSVPGAAFPDA